MSALDVVSRIFKPENVKAFKEVLAGKGISFTEEALANALGGIEKVKGSLIHTTHGQIGVTAASEGGRTVCSQLVSLVQLSHGSPVEINEKIAATIRQLLSDAAVMSNPKLALSGVGKGSKLALAA